MSTFRSDSSSDARVPIPAAAQPRVERPVAPDEPRTLLEHVQQQQRLGLLDGSRRRPHDLRTSPETQALLRQAMQEDARDLPSIRGLVEADYDDLPARPPGPPGVPRDQTPVQSAPVARLGSDRVAEGPVARLGPDRDQTPVPVAAFQAHLDRVSGAVADGIAQARTKGVRAAEAKGFAQEMAERDRKVELAAARDRRRRWSRERSSTKPATVGQMVAEVSAQADEEAASQGKARRLALQAATPTAQRDREHARWDQALAWESGPRDLVRSHVPAAVVHLSKSCDQIELLPEDPTGVRSPKAFAASIEVRRSSSIKREHAVAHLVVSTDVEVTAADFRTIARRLCARIGVDPYQQQVELFRHYDGKSPHCHLLVERTRSDGGVWTPGLGVDRALALECALLARESGVPWDQRMVARSQKSGVAAHLAAKGQLSGEIRYREEIVKIPWQGREADARVEADPLAVLEHGKACVLAKLVGYRDAKKARGYVGKARA